MTIINEYYQFLCGCGDCSGVDIAAFKTLEEFKRFAKKNKISNDLSLPENFYCDCVLLKYRNAKLVEGVRFKTNICWKEKKKKDLAK